MILSPSSPHHGSGGPKFPTLGYYKISAASPAKLTRFGTGAGSGQNRLFKFTEYDLGILRRPAKLVAKALIICSLPRVMERARRKL
jgi:hypothetical protein